MPREGDLCPRKTTYDWGEPFGPEEGNLFPGKASCGVKEQLVPCDCA